MFVCVCGGLFLTALFSGSGSAVFFFYVSGLPSYIHQQLRKHHTDLQASVVEGTPQMGFCPLIVVVIRSTLKVLQ